MSYLRGSANYVWCTTDVLGKGATGAVFRGVSKHDGEPVAVKTFNQISHMRPQEVQLREFEVLKKVKHENIVKLLGIEEEQDGRGKVIVMELCTGGSLFNILDDPENTYGLPEDEFLLVLDHLAAGIKHLRDKNLVHRDLKPGNIMKFIGEDGRTIYKLTDFGAARELEEDGEFMSLYGTEEYLHPDMYERAVLRKPVGKSYSAFVDLWSIGVTLFHVATGTLPFRPYGGRKNKEMMYYIVTKKESGVISGCQLSENGDIEWKRELPTTIQLSTGLKLLITPLLGGLMEVDPRKRWSFEKFFSSVTSLLSRTKVHLFYVNKIQELRIYLDTSTTNLNTNLNSNVENGCDLRALIREQTGIPEEHQILLFKNYHVISTSETKGVVPSTTEEQPLILCHAELNSVGLDWSGSGSGKEVKFPSFPNLVNVENDATLGKQTCAVGYSYKRRIERIVRSVSLISTSVSTLSSVIESSLTKLHSALSELSPLFSSLSSTISLITSLTSVWTSFSKTRARSRENSEISHRAWREVGERGEEELGELGRKYGDLEGPVRQLFSKLVEGRELRTDWKEATSDIVDISRCSMRASTHVVKLRESWQRLLHNRATRTLTYNDEQFHILERIKMGEKAKSLTNLLQEETENTLGRVAELLSDWFKRAKAALVQTEILVKDMENFRERILGFETEFRNEAQKFTTELETISQHFDKEVGPTESYIKKSSDASSLNSRSLDTGYHADLSPNAQNIPNNKSKGEKKSKESIRNFNRGLRELSVVQEEVWAILKENADLVDQFQTLTLSLIANGSSDETNGNDENYESDGMERNNSLI